MQKLISDVDNNLTWTGFRGESTKIGVHFVVARESVAAANVALRIATEAFNILALSAVLWAWFSAVLAHRFKGLSKGLACGVEDQIRLKFCITIPFFLSIIVSRARIFQIHFGAANLLRIKGSAKVIHLGLHAVIEI